MLYPFSPEDGGCNSNTPNNVPVSVMQFPIDGSLPAGQMVGNAGVSSTQVPTPQITVGSNGPVWLFDMPSQPASVIVAPLGGSQVTLQGTAQFGDLIGAAGDYVATANAYQPSDPMSPIYPCCNSSSLQMEDGAITQYALDGTPVGQSTVQAIVAGELPSAITASPDALFYIKVKQPGFGIEAVTGSDTVEMATVDPPSMTGGTPVGLVADNTHVAWAFAQDAAQTPLALGCQIWVVDDTPLASTNPVTSLFQSSSFSCMDLAIDPNAVYFTIVAEETDSNNGSQPYLHGVGIGRVDFAMHMFSSIAFDVAAIASGPRRIVTAQSDPNDLFVVDPLVVAKVAKMAFAGRMDISP